MANSCPVVLTIAGSDCSAGAGIQADIKTCGAMGVYACSVVTSVTAQSPGKVHGAFSMPASLVADQIRAIADSFSISVVKLGMLGNLAIAGVVAEFLEQTDLPAVIDPVFKSSSGASLCEAQSQSDDVVGFYRERLLPLATVATPNLNEAALLLSLPIAVDHNEYEDQAKALTQFGCKAVLLKGGHSLDERLSTDYLAQYSRSGEPIVVQSFASARLSTPHGHGTGCTMASAIAAGLAQGLSIAQAVAAAKNYIHASLMAADRLALVPAGGPVHHFSMFW